MSAGEDKVWETLKSLEPDKVCRSTGAVYDAATGSYTIKSLGKDFSISTKDRLVSSDSPGSEIFLQRLGYFFRLSITGYLTLSKDVAPTGRLVNPASMKSGQLFFRGSHTLPLDRAAEKFGSDPEGFLRRGLELGGEKEQYGDISFKLFPLPHVPVVLILWRADEEFPPRVDILFDSSSEISLPIDVIWAVAMLCILALL